MIWLWRILQTATTTPSPPPPLLPSPLLSSPLPSPLLHSALLSFSSPLSACVSLSVLLLFFLYKMILGHWYQLTVFPPRVSQRIRCRSDFLFLMKQPTSFSKSRSQSVLRPFSGDILFYLDCGPVSKSFSNLPKATVWHPHQVECSDCHVREDARVQTLSLNSLFSATFYMYRPHFQENCLRMYINVAIFLHSPLREQSIRSFKYGC